MEMPTPAKNTFFHILLQLNLKILYITPLLSSLYQKTKQENTQKSQKS